MKRMILSLFLLISALGAAHATDAVYGDLFPYENKHSSFTVDVDLTKLDRLSIQVVYSTAVYNDTPITGASIDTVNDTIAVSTNGGFAMAQPVLLASAPAAAPQPLVSGTTYFIFKVSDSLIKMATTYAQAVTGDTIDLLTAPAGNWTLKPVPLNTGSAGFSWLASNDATNYVSIGSVGSTVLGSTQSLVSMGPASLGTRLFDWGEFAYRYLRFTFTGPASGVIKLRAYVSAKLRS